MFGLTLPDPYRWMENSADPDWAPYMRAQNAYARARLDGIPGRAALARRIGELSGTTAAVGEVQRVGTTTFLTFRPLGADTYKLFVDAPGAARRLLLDPDRMRTPDGPHMSIDYWRASPDGRHLVVGVSPAGSEFSVAHVVRVADGALLPEAIDRAALGSPYWLPDSSGFFFTRQQPGATPGSPGYFLNATAWLHRLGTDPANDVRVAAHGMDAAVPMEPGDAPFLLAAPGSNQVVLVTQFGVRRTNPVWTADLDAAVAGRPLWRKVAGVEDEIVTAPGDSFTVALRGSHLYLLSEKNAPLGRILRVDATRPDLAAAREIVPQGRLPIETFAAARDALYVQVIDGGPERLKRVTDDGRIADISVPFDAGLYALFATPDQDGVDVRLSGWVQPFGVWRYHPTRPELADTGLMPRPPIDTAPYIATRLTAKAKDGARIPVFVVARRDTPHDGAAPCLLEAYGAYGMSTPPLFNPGLVPFLDAGGLYAVAGVRGGGEYGRPWWEAGKGANKHNTWQDAIAAAEALTAARWTSARRLTLWGTSAGGVMVGRAITERPDLFGGAVDNVGWVNRTRAAFEPNSVTNYAEFGDPAVEADFKNLYAMDAYQHVRDGVAYPAVLVIAGMTDPRVAPWNGGKFAARLQKASSSGKPILLRVDFEAGHGIGSTRRQRDELTADITAFALWQAGKAGYLPA